MTPLESRVASLEHNLVFVIAALEHVIASQNLFTAFATAQLQSLLDQMKKLRDDLNDGDEWKMT